MHDGDPSRGRSDPLGMEFGIEPLRLYLSFGYRLVGGEQKENITLLFLFNRWEGSEAQREQGNVQRLSRRKWESRDENQSILMSKCGVLFIF